MTLTLPITLAYPWGTLDKTFTLDGPPSTQLMKELHDYQLALIDDQKLARIPQQYINKVEEFVFTARYLVLQLQHPEAPIAPANNFRAELAASEDRVTTLINDATTKFTTQMTTQMTTLQTALATMQETMTATLETVAENQRVLLLRMDQSDALNFNLACGRSSQRSYKQVRNAAGTEFPPNFKAIETADDIRNATRNDLNIWEKYYLGRANHNLTDCVRKQGIGAAINLHCSVLSDLAT